MNETRIGTCSCNGCGNRPGPWHEQNCKAYMSDEDDWSTMESCICDRTDGAHDYDCPSYVRPEYKYEDPTTKGMTRVFLTQKQHNELFPHRPRSWKLRYDYFLDENRFEMHRMVSVVGQIIVTVLFPLSLLMEGFGNFKEIVQDHKKAIWQRTYGNFNKDVVFNNDRQQDLFAEICKQVRANESL